jgi:hypothetical protein
MAMKSIFEDELILPGVITEIVNDYIAGYDTSEFGTTDAVTIVGTAFNGPVGVPVPVFSPEYAKYMYGEAFDSATRREASLIPEIYDAWDRGCRTIYAVRLSGKDMYKDYELALESNLMLRVSGQFPCNENKECYMLYKVQQGSVGAGTIRLYKPATRTTVQEKLQGVVNNVNSILVTEFNLEANGITKGTRLIDLINKINSLNANNVITLSIVNKDGVVMTEADKEVQMLNVGDLFPGIYTLGRDKVGEGIDPKTNIEIVRTKTSAPYSNFKDAVWRKLVINTDVKQPYPLCSDDFNDFKSSLKSIVADSDFDFLKKIGLIDRLAVKDDVDYEEVDLDPFDIYCRLGKGFVKTAKIQKKVKGDRVSFKVVQPDEDDKNRVVGLNDGIYSVLENHKSDYIVLAGISAETVINNVLPRKEEFKVVNPGSISLIDMNAGDVVLRANCKVDAKNFNRIVDYDLSIRNVDSSELIQSILNHDLILNNLSPQKFLRVPVIAESELAKEFDDVPADTIALAINTTDPNVGVNQGQLVRFNAKRKMFDVIDFDLLGIGAKGDANYVSPKLLVQIRQSLKVFKQSETDGVYVVDDNPTQEELPDGSFKSYNFMVATAGTYANVYFVPVGDVDDGIENTLLLALRDIDNAIQKDADGCILTCKLDADSITPLISLKDLADGALLEEEFTICCMEQDMPKLPAEGISENETFVGIYSNEITFCSQEEMIGIINNLSFIKDKFVFELANSVNALEELPDYLYGSNFNRAEEFIYDEDMYIPYTTNDNFARHLAQHCLYTQLKTYPTHGVIGCSKLAGINLSTIAQRIDDICNFEFDLYAKKDNGNYMLDSDNEPYPLGRCISITFMQYTVGTGTSYNYVSNGAAGYAGMVSALPIERSSTNQPINVGDISFELSNYQLGRLNTKGIVCCKNTTTGGVVVVDGITQAPRTSAYRRLSTSKTINAVDRVLRTAIEPYIGLVDSLSTRNSLNTAIKSALNSLVDVIINDFKFKISTDASGGNLGVIRIDYVIVPLNEIREVRNRVEISDAI